MPGKWQKPVDLCMICLLFCIVSAGCSGSKEQIVPVLETAAQEWETTTNQKAADAPEETEAVMGETQAETVHNKQTMMVHVAGAVKCPGVYELWEGSRLWEAIQAAGGVLENGAGDYLNMAAVVSDGEKIVVPFLDEVEQPWGEAQKPAFRTADEPETALVNLNKASLEQLMTLPGIGEAKAEAILSYRDSVGGFSAPEDIMNVPGIKEGAYAKIKDWITVSQ